jgi:ComF family protein
VRGFDAAYCFGSYEGLLREWIHLYKYARIKPMARPLGELLAQAVPSRESFDAIVPVPLHWLREWRRGFNQSDILARGLGRRLRLPVVAALRRVRSTRVQAGLSNTARRQNVAQAFRIRHARSVAGKRILLVDDVMTTGSTAAACAAALKRAGVARVALGTVARVDRRMAVSRAVPQSTTGEFSDAE